MKVLVYSSKDFELPYLKEGLEDPVQPVFLKEQLSVQTAALAKGFSAVCVFINDDVSAPVIRELSANGVKYVVTRSAGYDHIDIAAASMYGIRVANVPSYSPYAVAEHAVALMLALNRHIVRADKQVHAHDFRLDELVGFDLHKRKVGIVGTGKIGSALARIMHGFGATLLAYDLVRNAELENKFNVYYTGLYTICSMCDIISLHLPLNDQTRGMFDKKMFANMQEHVMLINTARGALVQTADLLQALKEKKIGCYGADVYEKEKGLFFFDHSTDGVEDPVLNGLLSMPNVLLTPHQAFATKDALRNIAAGTMQNLASFYQSEMLKNEITHTIVSTTAS